MCSQFAQAFKATQKQGMKVLVTVSHSAPYGCDDRVTLMKEFFGDTNIDYLSPQLYPSGEETQNDYTEDPGVSWTDYSHAEAAVIPSLVQASMYEDAVDFFSGKGVTLGGFLQWARIS
jgi:hypothetical protein